MICQVGQIRVEARPNTKLIRSVSVACVLYENVLISEWFWETKWIEVHKNASFITMNTLDKQLADLRIYANELDAKLQDDINAAKKKPSIPPKKNKAPLPQIPQSCMVKSACEPSYSSRLEYGSKTSSTYSNLVPVKSCIVSVRNSARGRSGDVLLYSNLLPPGGTSHVYSNMMMPRNTYAPESIYGDRDTRSEVSRISDIGAQSNYSELRRPGSAYPPSSASVNAQDFSTYGGSQTSSTYESLYEPINPRPCSQLSGKSKDF